MSDWKGKRILILGGARQGIATARYFAQRGVEVIINDSRTLDQLATSCKEIEDLPVEWVCGGHPVSLFERGIDLVCVSGGIPIENPLVMKAKELGIPLSNDSQIFIEECPAKIVGITGSAGKTTTTTLTGRICQTGVEPSQRVWIGGNIGNPLINDVPNIKPVDIVILELSSFQLELMTLSPQVAAILNITPNHLDRHHTMENYVKAKANILHYQDEKGTAILNREDPGAWLLRAEVRGQLITFGHEKSGVMPRGVFYEDGQVVYLANQVEHLLLSKEDIQLRGDHNKDNVLAACAIAIAAGVNPSACSTGVRGFPGVPHRLEYIRNFRGADWYNDSIATAPERTIAAIKSFSEPLILLLGGRDKKLPWGSLVEIAKNRARHIVLFGEAGALIQQAFNNNVSEHKNINIAKCQNLREAVEAAARLCEPGDVVILSPGGTSFDEFKDFEERGERFIQWVKELQ